MKKFLLVLALALVFLTGCSSLEKYHDGDGKSWIEQQVEKGTLTRAEADKLLEQEATKK